LIGLGRQQNGERLDDKQNDEFVSKRSRQRTPKAGRIKLRTCATQSAGLNAAR
jgi:hypothetical protein